ncbi:hypothetical protein TSTA_064730 [Talaromyces stipitatus ATCC 10500]|uniref:Fungal-type protein kinase domain-containing protein n=1 Tax=Talaromyces stipitatus (strain ATCC 10500 / CBS 375.48 / QM 6759 / NRRL 1006) TaxID=441959 RepID=B8LTC9_TALSN|nr:uncharacterized protein TSTA_064730 [Talaromyces stipitatus ATCC 10500]EED23007.1 hypothetical protein TSTA_064730 [Talaromyces stipitatus ATCC 10500]
MYKIECKHLKLPVTVDSLDKFGYQGLELFVKVIFVHISHLPVAEHLHAYREDVLSVALRRMPDKLLLGAFEPKKAVFLMKAVLGRMSDIEVWTEVLNVVDETTPSSATSQLEQTRWRNTDHSMSLSECHGYFGNVLEEKECPTSKKFPNWYFKSAAKTIARFTTKRRLVLDRNQTDAQSGKGVLTTLDAAAFICPSKQAARKLDERAEARHLFVSLFTDLGTWAAEERLCLDDHPKSWLELGAYATKVQSEQLTRRFVCAFTLSGNWMRVWLFGRLGNKIPGRGTMCWRGYAENNPQLRLVIKDSSQYEDTKDEGELLRKVTEKGVINITRQIIPDKRLIDV